VKQVERGVAVDVLRLAEPQQPHDVRVALEQKPERLLEAVEDDVDLVDLPWL
jgi:hypothetical protein